MVYHGYHGIIVDYIKPMNPRKTQQSMAPTVSSPLESPLRDVHPTPCSVRPSVSSLLSSDQVETDQHNQEMWG